MTEEIDVPEWDIALEGLARELHAQKTTPLRINDFRRLATDHGIRFDDIMVTMFELVMHGRWRYRNRAGETVAFPPDVLDKLYVNRRLQEVDLQDYDGGWEPA